MAITLGRLRFVSSSEASVADLREERDERTKAHGLVSPCHGSLLSWREALARIYPEPRSYSAFKRLVRCGVRAGRGGPVVKLACVERPGGRCCTVEQVETFVREYERCAERGEEGARLGRAVPRGTDAAGSRA